MDTKHFELLLRRTRFGHAILNEAWDGLTVKERIELLLHLIPLGSSPRELITKALNDPSPVVRMLAVKGSCISKQDPDLYAKVQSDPSPLVRAALALNDGGLIFDLKGLLSMPQIERLGVIALSDPSIDGENFAQFIVDNLQNKAISESEAAELVDEFVRNPHAIFEVEAEPIDIKDGIEWYSRNKGFTDIWNLTTCTPFPVHRAVAWKYPLYTGDGDTIPDEMLGRMSVQALEALVFRGHKPLLDRLEKNPEQFDERVRKAIEAAAIGEDGTGKGGTRPESEIGELREELNELRTEMRELFQALRNQIDEAASRRRGLFG